METSAGLLMYRRGASGVEVLVVHPGGPFFRRRHEGVWSIPKGLVEEDGDFLEAARREFAEETGLEAAGDFLSLGSVKQKGGKVVHAWAFEGDCDPRQISSNTFSLEWPPGSGKEQEFPEVDEARFASLEEARGLLVAAQCAFLKRLAEALEED